jgi:indole-3-glycerol phosphate synthase
MVTTIPDILARIVEAKRAGLPSLAGRRKDLEAAARQRVAPRDFRDALLANPPAVIAEVKQASPSKGALTGTFAPARIAGTYESGGAACLSVLTDEEFFHGSLKDLEAARAATSLPVLRKDFTIDELHIVEAAAHGADAILLIAALLEEQQLRRFRELAEHNSMATLVEVHSEEELELAINSGATILGVNNRNLHTFEVSLETSLRLAERIPAGVIRVGESGISSREDVKRLEDAGYHAFLVGEYLMRSADPAQALRDLRS